MPTTWDWARYMLHLNTPKAAKLIKFNQTASCWLALATTAMGHKKNEITINVLHKSVALVKRH